MRNFFLVFWVVSGVVGVGCGDGGASAPDDLGAETTDVESDTDDAAPEEVDEDSGDGGEDSDPGTDGAEVGLDIVITPFEVDPMLAPAPTVTWEPCGTLADLEDVPRVECAEVTVPLDWKEPDGETITLWVKRLRADDAVVGERPRKAVWFLMGGPGQAGADAEGLVWLWSQRMPMVDFYLPDHRGTGRSTRLGCELQEMPWTAGGPYVTEEEWPSCRDTVLAEWGERLMHFSTTQAARDLIGLLQAVHSQRDEVTLLGISYGTYLASRYILLAEAMEKASPGSRARVAGLVLDSICPPEGCHLSEQDLWEDREARRILARCEDDPDCGPRFVDNSVEDELIALYRAIENGHCPLTSDVALDVELLRTNLGMMMFNYGARRGVPALVKRYRRCNEDDMLFVRKIYERNFGFDPGALSGTLPTWPGPWQSLPLGGYSFPLAINILISEMWEAADPSPEELVERWENTLSCRGVSENASWQTAGWPRYRDNLAGRWFETDMPILALNADFDPATPEPLASRIAEHLDAPHQRYLVMPGHGHNVLVQGQLVDDPTVACGLLLFEQFVADPKADLDLGCIERSLALKFSMRPQAVQYWFGTTDLWGDTTSQ